ncbi:MAG: methylenetetrahydrofolate reductase C-terminal domain-containing protein [Armatimonadetes bacterium]|nr:methylenetetrahydrofolate reductase C-terminal domain-containing protein [Armatimonadota bacterium]
MIVGERKPLDEIWEFVQGYRRLLVVGCGGCVTVCLAGGEAEVKTVASALRIAARRERCQQEILEDCVTRQCEPEFVEALRARVAGEGIDAVLSLACGVGVNFLAERLGDVPVFPGINTRFLGAAVEAGVWVEMCAGCGNCMLHLTGGICPVARCSKSILNGPCGGSNGGKCEISPDLDCAWALILERMKRLGTLDRLLEVTPPRDWSTSRHGGPRRTVREDVRELAVDSKNRTVVPS